MLIVLAITLCLALLMGLPVAPVLIIFGLITPLVAFALTRARAMLHLAYSLAMILFAQNVPALFDIPATGVFTILQSPWIPTIASVLIIAVATIYGLFMPRQGGQAEQEQSKNPQ